VLGTLNEVVNTEEQIIIGRDPDKFTMEEMEGDIAKQLAEGRDLSFFDSLENTSFITDVAFKSISDLLKS
jgi:phosphoribulokinase